MLNLGRVNGIHVQTLSAGWATNLAALPIPAGWDVNYATSTQGEKYSLHCILAEGCQAETAAKLARLRELRDNPGYPFHYFEFRGEFEEFTGWYAIGNIGLELTGTRVDAIEFDMDVVLKYRKGERRLATYWDSAAEVYSWASQTLTATNGITLPYNASSVAWAILATRTGSDGSSQVLANPTRQRIDYKSSARVADWYKMEPRVWDTGVEGDTDTAHWVRALSPHHDMAGDTVIENGLLRYSYDKSAGTGTFYVYDTTLKAWVSIGVLQTYGNGANLFAITQFQITKLTSERVEWKELRQYDDDVFDLSFTLWRGTRYCRIRLETHACDIPIGTYTRLLKTGGFTYMFNAASAGTMGIDGNLTADTASNYLCGYNTTDDVIAGIILCDKPAAQPYDTGGNQLPVSLTWTTSEAKIFFVFGWPQETSGLANKVQNPGYETAGAGHPDLFANWAEADSDGDILDAVGGHSGTHSIQLVAGATATTFANSNIMTVVPGATYDISYWTKGNGATGAVRYGVYNSTTPGWIIAPVSTGVTAGTWTRKTTTVLAPALCTQIFIEVICPAVVGDSGYFDDWLLLDLTAVRAEAAIHAAHALKNIDAELTLVPLAYFE